MELFHNDEGIYEGRRIIDPHNIKVKILHEGAKLPTRGSEYAAGVDLHACIGDDIVINPHQRILIGTGIAISIPEGTFGGIFARSGLAYKEGLGLANGVGVVDSDYTGEVKVALVNNSSQARVITHGERIAQLILLPFLPPTMEIVSELDKTDRGDGGFGHTGK